MKPQMNADEPDAPSPARSTSLRACPEHRRRGRLLGREPRSPRAKTQRALGRQGDVDLTLGDLGVLAREIILRISMIYVLSLQESSREDQDSDRQ
jgi:hypothetical protein